MWSKRWSPVFCVIFFICSAFCMTEQQLKATSKMVRNVCQPKSKATNEAVDGMHEGIWDIDQNAMCYLHCCINYMKLMNKDNTFNLETAQMQLKTLPEERKAPTAACMEQCKDSIKTFEDKCQAAYELAKCMYDCNPKEYLIP
ncbi:unnamed protein product [Brassicogethes aeneus]|uniref:Uncharacterized protein n=1 Tax=Brassicogethes aeneus TaxID=1431903 RepID=A0A9P0FI14_BRAAE|nr:unnamed protein product [Brassicogethes aeneus]